MGCDVHMFAEVRKVKKWKDTGKVFVSQWDSRPTYHPYEGRNYDLFAMLANVRNGRGFAGIDTGDGFKPITMPKGLPEDVSTAIKNESDAMASDGHSHSWLTLRELLDYDWVHQATRQRGWVNLSEYKVFKEKGKPESWCGGISGHGIKYVTNEEMDAALSLIDNAVMDKNWFTKIEWAINYHTAAGSFVTKTMPALKELGEPEDVRIVFWFDN